MLTAFHLGIAPRAQLAEQPGRCQPASDLAVVSEDRERSDA